MKRPLTSCSKSSHGFALIIVLAVLVLLVALAVGFLNRATTERTASAGFHAAARARQIADSAVSLVQSQINQATSQANVGWASQPGAIRTFDAGGERETYKLYSADQMIDGGFSAQAEAGALANWNSSPAIFTNLNQSVESSGTSVYPILDPEVIVNNAVPGFAINNPPAGVTAGGGEMPARWLYVLQDGTLVNPSGSGTTASVAGASAANPIIGRVAFWTDDESSKVNINTASEGTYWDVPRAVSQQERDLGNYQPARREFQAYPGHPATTSLSAVFPEFDPDDLGDRNEIYNLVPRVIGGGSNNGTTIVPNTSTGLSPDADRLYSNVDELYFTDSPATPRNNNAGIDKDMIEGRKFLLTANSRSPELNLFNLPRIATWPIYEGAIPEYLSAFDKLIAFCATVNDEKYYFQRKNAQDPFYDISIDRNQKLLAYLRQVTSKTAPGFTQSLEGKYGADRDQILTQIFDYIRITNLHDDLLPNAANRFTKSANTQGWGFVVPSVDSTTSTMGLGRTFTLSELAMAFICTAQSFDDTSTPFNEADSNSAAIEPPFPKPWNPSALGANQRRIQAFLLPEIFCPALGWAGVWPDIRMTIEGLNTMTLNGVNLGFPASTFVDYRWHYTSMRGRAYGGGNWRYGLYGQGGYPLVSNLNVVVNSSQTVLPFSGGTVTVKFSSRSEPSKVYQTMRIVLPQTDIPVPRLVATDAANGGTADKRRWWTVKGGIDGGRQNLAAQPPGWPGNPGPGMIIRREFDVVRSVLPRHGDYRLLAASNNLDDQPLSPDSRVFRPHPNYNVSTWSPATTNVAATLSTVLSSNDSPHSDQAQRLIPGLTMPTDKRPDIYPGYADDTSITENKPSFTGDFDAAIANAIDGAYINKPDEGNVTRTGGVPYFESEQTFTALDKAYFSPNRVMPSPVMFGSLPSQVKAGKPWQTLLFRPQLNHPSFSGSGRNAPDHLWLDLFWMPVVEPYAISEPFSTAGKVNLNYQIVPYTYIERSTGIRAVLKNEKVAAIPDGRFNTYKSISSNDQPDYRLPVRVDETLTQFQDKFDNDEFFRSATEICELHIVPQDAPSVSGMESYWQTRRLTGDNVKERIYATVYPRLTTKSNTFTVHFRAQALKGSSTNPGQWDEEKDAVLAEYRGSSLIERYLDPNDENIPNYADGSDPTTKQPLSDFYRWRTVSSKQFAP